MTTTVAEGKQRLKLINEAGDKLLIGHHRDHIPIMAKSKVLVVSSKPGKWPISSVLCITHTKEAP